MTNLSGMQLLPMQHGLFPRSVITYDALELMWEDGLHGVRQLLAPTQSKQGLPTSGQACQPSRASPRWKCSSLDELHWYITWKSLPGDKHSFDPLPEVSTGELLSQLGVPAQQVPDILPHLSSSSLQFLKIAVLPSFKTAIVATIAGQLPELKLLDGSDGSDLFAG